MQAEKLYSTIVTEEHLKTFGQYFTPYSIAEFMCSWACPGAGNILDPAVGNSIFLTFARKINPACSLHGYEVDATVLTHFGNPAGADIRLADYLLTDWEERYDAIVCNPPYNRFQAIANRSEILQTIEKHTGVRYSNYTNLYILFLIKSLHQLKSNGKLAYIIPTEFLNSRYGIPIKKKLLEERLLRAIINIEDDDNLFFNATTTCCILLIDHMPKTQILFKNEKCHNIGLHSLEENAISISYDKISAEDKWRSFLNQEELPEYKNLRLVSDFCKISRGIATGANEFFCMSEQQRVEKELAPEYFTSCICRSAEIRQPIFTQAHLLNIRDQGKNVWLLNIKKDQKIDNALQRYLEEGIQKKIPAKHLPSHRHPWYLMEQRKVAPIWVTTASRGSLKFVRNLAEVMTLTTFHSIYPMEEYTDLLFCYFLTPTAQKILRMNRKELGNGLEKFQPSDLQSAKMLDLSIITDVDKNKIAAIYQKMLTDYHSGQIDELEILFCRYINP